MRSNCIKIKPPSLYCKKKHTLEETEMTRQNIFPQSNSIQFCKGIEYYAEREKKVLAVADVYISLQTACTAQQAHLCLFLYKNSCCTVSCVIRRLLASASSSVCRLGRCRGFRLQSGGRDQLPDGVQLFLAPVQLQEHSWGPHGPRWYTRCLLWFISLFLYNSLLFASLE